MTQTHPITPPEDLLHELVRNTDAWLDQIIIAYQAGADMELEACCEWLTGYGWSGVAKLRAIRRPKPPISNPPRTGGPSRMTDPTDEEIMELMPQQMHDDLAAAARALAEQAGTDNRRAMGVMRIILNRHAVDHARAVLVKWGHQ
jgi:hypothetical protein